MLLTWLALPATVALAQDHITHRTWLEDPDDKLSWPEVRHHPVQPYTGTLSACFGDSAIWLRLRINPGAAPASDRPPARLVLRMHPVYLDEIQVYDPLAASGLVEVTGDMHHPRLDEFNGLDFLVPVAGVSKDRLISYE